MNDQKYKRPTLINDSLKAHHRLLKWNLFLSFLWVIAAIYFGIAIYGVAS